MSNKKMILSEDGKVILDDLAEHLDFERPFVIQIALAKGIQISNGIPDTSIDKGSKKWTISDNIIKDDDFILFKSLIQNEANEIISNDQLQKYMILFIEIGLRELSRINLEKSSMEDLRLAII